MQIKSSYKKRPIRFIELYAYDGWQITIYGISIKGEFVNEQNRINAKTQLHKWLQNSNNYELDTYKIATLILHEGKEGCFAIINWWIDENMLQQHVYLATNSNPAVFSSYSTKEFSHVCGSLPLFGLNVMLGLNTY
jgi:hypothetical protein